LGIWHGDCKFGSCCGVFGGLAHALAIVRTAPFRSQLVGTDRRLYDAVGWNVISSCDSSPRRRKPRTSGLLLLSSTGQPLDDETLAPLPMTTTVSPLGDKIPLWFCLTVNDVDKTMATSVYVTRTINIDTIALLVHQKFPARLRQHDATDLEIYAHGNASFETALDRADVWSIQQHGGDSPTSPLVARGIVSFSMLSIRICRCFALNRSLVRSLAPPRKLCRREQKRVCISMSAPLRVSVSGI
jgi:hypothetical protein